MGHFKINERDIFFILKEQLNYGTLCQLDRYRELDEETLDMAIIAQKAMDRGTRNDFYQGKVMQATYFCGTTLPLTMGRLDTCLREGQEIVEMPEEAF